MITVIGRGHSGTRAIAKTLDESGVFMGRRLNESGDLMGYHAMYQACRLAARCVRWNSGLSWDWSELIEGEIPDACAQLVRTYLASVLDSDAEHKGWKLPETVLALPWIVRLYPEVKYIYWIRDPRDVIQGRHKMTDDLATLGVLYPHTDSLRRRRAISWLYQYEIVQATPKPEHWIEVRFEDFVLCQEKTLAQLEAYLGMKLVRVPVRREAVGRYKADKETNYFDFLESALIAYGYRGEAARW